MTAVVKVEGMEKLAGGRFPAESFDLDYFPDPRKRSRTKDVVERMAESLLTVGQVQAIRYAPTESGDPGAIDGRTRILAMRLLEERFPGGPPEESALGDFLVDATLDTGDNWDDLTAKVKALAANTARTPQSELEIAEGVKALEEGGLNVSQIAQRIGMSRSTVTLYRDLLKKDPEVQRAVARGEMAVSATRGLPEDLEEQRAVVEQVREEKAAGAAVSRERVKEIAQQRAEKTGKGGSGPSGARTKAMIDKFYQAVIDTLPVKEGDDGADRLSKGDLEFNQRVVKFCKQAIKFNAGAVSEKAWLNQIRNFGKGE